MIIPPLHN